MTTAELNEILGDENRKLTADELKEVIWQLKQDCWGEYYKENAKENANNFKMAHLRGEINAFFICLDLLEHLKGADDEQRETDL
jgi:hypothetical protein